MRIGVTGHQRLADISMWDWIHEQIDELLSALPPPLLGLSSLAVGADQVFAKSVLRRGGSFIAIIPFAGYEEKFSNNTERRKYISLLSLAAKVEVLNKSGSNREAYFQAGKQIVH